MIASNQITKQKDILSAVQRQGDNRMYVEAPVGGQVYIGIVCDRKAVIFIKRDWRWEAARLVLHKLDGRSSMSG